MVQKSLFSSQSVEWGTPQWLFDALDREFGFTLDPCCTHKNAKCDHHYTEEEDGLRADWSDEVVFMNPPYGRVIGNWMKKAFDSAKLGAVVVCLVPARTDARWWHSYCMRGAEIRLIRGRRRFIGGKHAAPFPSAMVIMRPPMHKLSSLEKREKENE